MFLPKYTLEDVFYTWKIKLSELSGGQFKQLQHAPNYPQYIFLFIQKQILLIIIYSSIYDKQVHQCKAKIDH